MAPDYFRTGGPFNARREDENHISWSIPISRDEHGRIARCCPDEGCSPGYFAVCIGTGIMEEQSVAYCPYCRHESEPSSFLSKEQVRYLQEVALHEATQAFQNMLKKACRGGGGTLQFKPARISQPTSPFEEEVRRDVICPHCGLDHAVYGVAIWCPDCGRDILMTHIKAEYAVVSAMLSDVERRGRTFGPRIAARDLENCLEDVVSISEAVLKVFIIRHLRLKGESEEEIRKLLENRIRNGFQNPERASEIVRNRMGLELFDSTAPEAVQLLKDTFEKRHPITHNLGVIDRKYLERAQQAEKEGRDVRVTNREILSAMELSYQILEQLHTRLFPSQDPSPNSDHETDSLNHEAS